MANKLFQLARDFVNEAGTATPAEKEQAILKAKNALSSAFANATFAEQQQLQQLQMDLDQIESS